MYKGACPKDGTVRVGAFQGKEIRVVQVGNLEAKSWRISVEPQQLHRQAQERKGLGHSWD